MIAWAASSPPLPARAAYAASAPASTCSRGLARPISPVEQTRTSIAPMPELLGDPLGDGVGGLEAVGAGVAVGAAGVEDHRPDDAVL